MLVPNDLKAVPDENYDDLKRQFFALKKLCESKMKQCSNYSKKLAEYDRESLIAGNEALESEREMNAQLTEELEAANERVKELEGNLSDSEVLINQLGGDRSLLKDYAIRQQMIILETLLGRTCPVSGLVIPDKRSREAIEDHLEQLRKELE